MKFFALLLIYYVHVIKAADPNDIFLTHYWPIQFGTISHEIDGANKVH